MSGGTTPHMEKAHTNSKTGQFIQDNGETAKNKEMVSIFTPMVTTLSAHLGTDISREKANINMSQVINMRVSSIWIVSLGMEL